MTRCRWAATSTRRRRLGGDDGVVGGSEVLPFGFLTLVAGSLLLANVWGVVDARNAVSLAAREGVRAYVEADDESAATAAAVARASETLDSLGRVDGVTVEPPAVDGGFGRCRRVTLTVRADIPAIAVPFLDGLGTTSVSATHSELIDPFRSGLPGAAEC